MKKFLKNTYFAIIILFIYAPIITMIIFSFNNGETTDSWSEFSLKNYTLLLSNSPFLNSIITTLFVAIISTVVSVIIGTLAAIGLSKTKKVTRNKWYSIANIPLVNADVVTAVSLMIVFLLSGLKFGVITLIMAHISFNVPYVLVTVMPRLRKIDPSLIEASYDLGAKNRQVMFKVMIPILKPAIITASAIAFAMSFDDFIISYFTGGDQTNISTFIYSAKKVRPFIFAFGTILVGVIAFSVIIWNAVVIYKQNKAETRQKLQNDLYKAKQLTNLNQELEDLTKTLQSKTIVKKRLKINLWLKYFVLKFKLFIFKINNYDKKISKLQWKQYKLKSKIGKEKRYQTRLKKANKKLTQLNKQLAKTTDIKKAAKLTLQIENLTEKIEFLEDQVQVVEERQEATALKIKKLKQKVKALKNDLKNEKDPSKKLVEWYQNKINYFNEWIIELEEGKDHYNLRIVVEKLHELQDVRKNKIVELNDKINAVLSEIYLTVSITKQLDAQIDQASDLETKIKLEDLKAQKLNKFNLIYADKINKKQQQIEKINNHILKLKNKLFIQAEAKTHSKSFLAKSWKTLLVSLVGIGAFCGLTTAYILNNTYDLIVANWGEYIDTDIIRNFQQQTKKRISYQTYDSNENLYNKIQTVEYDLMVPSDYMIQRLVNDGKLQKIDYSRLNVWAEFDSAKGSKVKINENNKSGKQQIHPSLLSVMAKSEVKPPEDPNEEEQSKNHSGILNTNSIVDFAVPYLWGDLSIIVNPTEENKNFLKQQGVKFDDSTGEIENSTLSWEILETAANANKKVVLNNDPKNVFQIGAQIVYQKPNLESEREVNKVADRIRGLIQNSNVSLNGDDLISKATNRHFDFAVMYNGDAATANKDWNNEHEDEQVKFIFGRPNKEVNTNNNGKRYQTTNIYSDSIVISKTAKNLDLAYEFINFLYENSADITSYVGQASPSVETDEKMTKKDEGEYADFKNLYLPITAQEKNGTGKNKEFKTNNNERLAFTYNGKIDEHLVNLYTKIVAGKR
ncbi:spermidine/putrescine ABC transporter permease/substrate-binding protein [Mycoplasma putrefaciens]|uniref:spermidine/putrescine ABC transporter permease/substrate-binding protein n=1 Tax=Mycoplasma putrefaciens TaxID=2123 RepID=UPI003DA21B57